VSVTITVTACDPTNIVITPAEYRTREAAPFVDGNDNGPRSDIDGAAALLDGYRNDLRPGFPRGRGVHQRWRRVWTLTGVGVPRPACNLNPANYATPCAQKPLT
jgi:hypothetical protein